MRRHQKKYIVLGGVLLCACLLFVPKISFASGWFDVYHGFLDAVSFILYYFIFVPITWIASAAIALFGFAIDSNLVSGPNGVLNRGVIYELWKFIRDFFNIFFILMLLIGAFSMVFQLEQYNAKNTILKIVLAALLINFSFPIARVMIDVSNVPMYFFAKQMVAVSGATGAANALEKSALSSTKIEKVLIPPSKDPEKENYKVAGPSRLIIAIIFMFIFSISLAILAVMFVIRLTMLIVLVIFSPVAFVSLFPGVKEYSDKWWRTFNQYLIFGPSAMLMLLVTVRFMDAIGKDAFYERAGAAASQAAGTGSANLVAQQFIFLSIPIIMIWLTLKLSTDAKIMGASTVEGWGRKAVNWGKKGASGLGMAFVPNNWARGAGKGITERMEKTPLLKLATQKGRADQAKAMEEAGTRFTGGEKVRKAFAERKVNEKVEDHKKNKTSASAREEDLKSKDALKSRAAALSLAETKDIDTADRLAGSLNAVSDNLEQFKKVTNAAEKNAFNDMTQEQFLTSVAKRNDKGEIVKVNGKTEIDTDKFKILSGKMKKEGNIKTLIEYHQSTEGGGKTAEAAYKEVVGKMNDKAIAGLDSSVHSDAGFQEYVKNNIAVDRQKFQKIMYSDEMSNDSFVEWSKMAKANGINMTQQSTPGASPGSARARGARPTGAASSSAPTP